MAQVKIKDYLQKNKTELLIVLTIFLVALFLRLYKISDFLTFLGDEGRDVRVVRDLITKGDLIFIGPQTSVGNMYLGPLYYYLIAPALFLSRLDPVGPAIANALIGSLTVLFTWFVGRQWFGKIAGIFAALFFALSPVAIIYSRSSWNPNPAPLFALICAYGIYQVWAKQVNKWIIPTAISLAFALQMHYLCLLLVPFLGVFWLLSLRSQSPNNRSQLVRSSIYGFLAFVLLMSPLFLFDMKHDAMNFKAFKGFFTDRQTTINLNPARSDRFLPVMNTIVYDLYLARQNTEVKALFWFLVVALVFTLFSTRFSKPAILISTWITLAILGLGVYKQHVYIHYLGFIYPAAYLLLGLTFSEVFQKGKLYLKVISLVALIYLVYLNILHSPIKEAPNRQLTITEEAVDLIIQQSGGQPFNFGLIAKQNYDESYRYFFENKKAKMIRGEDGITSQLFVVCEDGDKCQPEGNPAYQVAIFGPAKVAQMWQINHLKIYKMLKKE